MCAKNFIAISRQHFLSWLIHAEIKNLHVTNCKKYLPGNTMNQCSTKITWWDKTRFTVCFSRVTRLYMYNQLLHSNTCKLCSLVHNLMLIFLTPLNRIHYKYKHPLNFQSIVKLFNQWNLSTRSVWPRWSMKLMKRR